MSSNQQFKGESASLELLEDLYQKYQENPDQLNPSWKAYFSSFNNGTEVILDQKRLVSTTLVPSDLRIERLVEAYRRFGHFKAKVNPIALEDPAEPSAIQTAKKAFQPHEFTQSFPTLGLLEKDQAPLNEIIAWLESIYCDGIGFDYKDRQNPEVEKWIQHHIESNFFKQQLSNEQKILILKMLGQSEIFETFLHTKYVGQKRFSLEGSETLIPMLSFLLEKGAEEGVEEVVLGMAHRGRLNVLSNILHKSMRDIFYEFDDIDIPESFEGTGDVKYHKGYKSKGYTAQNGKLIRLALTSNPSHLESVDSVVEGQTRAKQFLENDEPERKLIIPVLVHGDAALSGQGVVYETLQLSHLPAFTTGGTIHFVLNNQIGFTTLPKDLRSTPYCTDIARTFQAPVFHVNAEDPEDCVLATLLAFTIRQTFHCEVFIDLNCYRKYGHNETDEPAFTQPLEYQMIRKKRPIRETYRQQLIEKGILDQESAEKIESEFRQGLQEAHQLVKEKTNQPSKPKEQELMEIPSNEMLFKPFPTGVSMDRLKELAERANAIPPNFHIHPKLENLLKDRKAMVLENKPIDWGTAETLAYASLLWDGISIRLSGQDTGRGTFSHRHALWVDQTNEKDYYPLNHLKEDQGQFQVVNSPLSEFAVLAFEYGYSLSTLQDLTIWEAQFGDFSNGAQVIIDQYIASAEQKWGQKSGLVLFLPHGYEGQGPEHSSGRLERFLSLAGHDNIQVVNPTTPAQFFHLLRRQVLRDLHKPLIVFTPKGLLRHPACVNDLKDFEQGYFQDILDDPAQPKNSRRLVLCSGRIYYDLIAEREKPRSSDLAIIRLEQLYPLNQNQLREVIESYSQVSEYFWVQEEHSNMGAWTYIRPYLEELLPENAPLKYIGRSRSASPATGSHSRHEKEHANILTQVFKQ